MSPLTSVQDSFNMCGAQSRGAGNLFRAPYFIRENIDFLSNSSGIKNDNK